MDFSILREKIKQLLRYTERFTKTDMLYVARGGFWSLLGQGSNLTLSFLLALAFGNLLSPTVYGQYKYILSLATMVSAFTLTGSNTAVIQGVARGFEGVFKKIVIMNLRWGIVLGLGTAVASGYYFYNGNAILGTSLLFIAVIIPVYESINFYSCFLIGKKLLREKTLYETVGKVAYVLTMLIAILLTDNVLYLVITYLLATILITLGAYLLTVYRHHPNNAVAPDSLSFVKHLSVMNALTAVSEQLDSILVFHYLGAGAVAIYAFSQLPVDQLMGIIRTPLLNLISPKLAQKNLAELKKSIIEKSVRLFLILIPITVASILVLPFLFRWFFPQYISSVIYAQVYALMLLFIPYIFFSESLNMHGRKKELYIVRLIVPPAKIIALLVFLPLYGIWGALAAIFMAKIINGIVFVYIFKKI